MKKGCFLSSIIFLTIISGVGFYLYKKYWHEIKGYGKDKVIELSVNELEKKIDKLQPSIYRDSLKIFFHDQAEKLKDQEFEHAFKQFGDLVEEANFFIKDGKIELIEFNALKKMVNENERSKKN